MELNHLWRAARRSSGRSRRVRLDILLIPLVLALALLAWDVVVKVEHYPAYILPAPDRVWARAVAMLS